VNLRLPFYRQEIIFNFVGLIFLILFFSDMMTFDELAFLENHFIEE
jgi:hypothetical protein